MKKHLLKICMSSCVFFFTLAIGCFAFFGNANRTYAYDIVINEEQQVEDVYEFDSSFTLPSASFKVGEQDVPATDRYIVFPNGRIYTSDTVKLNVEGEYTLVYSAVVDGKKVRDESVKFKVYNKAWKNDYDSTIVEYNDGTAISGKKTTGDNAIGLFHYPGKSGLHLSVADGDMWTHNKVIDLTDNTGLSPVFEFAPWNCSDLVPKLDAEGNIVKDSNGEVIDRENNPEATNIFVRFTDAYDPENYFNVKFHYYRLSATRYQVYITVTSPGVDTIGLKKGGGPIVINNVAHTIYRNHNYDGAYGAHGYRTSRGAKIYYDNETKVVTVFDGVETHYVTDLDNKSIYTRNMFKGFTTGEVYLSVYSEMNNDAQTNYDIFSIDGVKGEALTKEIIDDKAPVIKVDIKDSLRADGIAIAKNEPFKIFDAEAFDVNLSGDISAMVYYNYRYENNMCMTYNGYFTPKAIGSYAIVYRAVDAFGNEADEVIELTCVNKEKCIDLILGDFESSYEVAKVNSLPEYKFTSLNNLKNVKLEITIEKDGKVYNVDPTANTFYLEEAGAYKVTYSYNDGIVAYSDSFDIKLVASNNLSLDADRAAFPEYFIKGMTYTLEQVRAYTYDTGKPIAHKPKFFVSNDEGAFNPANSNELKIEADKKIQFKYTYEANGETIEHVTETFTVINDAYDPSKPVGAFKQRYLQENYFTGDVTATQETGAVRLASNKTTGKANIDFINVLSLEEFQFEFTVPSGYDNFASFEIKVIDFYNRNNVVTISYRGNASTTYVKINDGLESTIKRGLVSSTAFRLEQTKGMKFSEASGITLDAGTQFTSDKILLHFAFTGVKGDAAVDVRKINSQQFTKYASDLPGSVIADTTYKGAYSLGETVKCLNAIPTDVMNPFYGKNFSIQVFYMSPQGGVPEPVYDVNGKMLSFNSSWEFEEEYYEFELAKIGNYMIQYYYEDQGGKEAEYSNLIQVGDSEPPKFQIKKEGQVLNKNTVIQAKLNDSYSFPGVQATDNITPTSQMTIRIVLMRPDTAMLNITTGSYTFRDKGLHRVSYMVFDGSGNYSLDYFYINVQ